MGRNIAAVIAALVTWGVVVTLLNFGLRAAIPGYHAAEPTMEFTLAMKLGRLTESVLASLAAGAVAGRIAPRAAWTGAVAGAIILLAFLPVHWQLWAKFPVWYHLAFLVPLVPVPWLSARAMAARA